MGTLLSTPAARYVSHIVIAFFASFVPLWVATGMSTEKAVLISTVVAAVRALIGATTSTNPQIGANIV